MPRTSTTTAPPPPPPSDRPFTYQDAVAVRNGLVLARWGASVHWLLQGVSYYVRVQEPLADRPRRLYDAADWAAWQGAHPDWERGPR